LRPNVPAHLVGVTASQCSVGARRMITATRLLQLAQGWSCTRPTLDYVPSPLHNSERVASVPNITLVEFDSVERQELAELVLERAPAVMFGLVEDVALNRWNLRGADGEDAITVLPREVAECGVLRLKP
jgi:hypothetical protein